jgi:uncharacterized protein (DUF983 family)
MPEPDELGARAFFGRVLAGRCPQCGRGPLFERFARLRPTCPECGLVYRREQGAQTGSMYLTAAVNQLFAVGVMVALWWTDLGLGVALAIAVPLVLAFSVLFLPWSMSIWVGVEYWTDVKNRESWARPRR